jgi:multiple sugar transport system ATP-binding protein
MNFLPARWNGERLETPLGSLELAEDTRGRVAAVDGPLIMGFRPDHPWLGEKGLCFEAVAEVVEWLGSDLFVHFDVAREGFPALALPEDLDGGGRRALVARIEPEAGVKAGDTLRLFLDPEQVRVFDAGSGENLTRHDGEA